MQHLRHRFLAARRGVFFPKAGVTFLLAFLAVAHVRPANSVRFRVEHVADGLKNPSAMAFLPNGHAIIAQRGSGELSLLDLQSGAATTITGTPKPVTGLDAGMCDVALHPDFAANGWIYFAYSEGTTERSTTAIGRGRLDGTRLIDVSRVFVADAYSEDRTATTMGRSDALCPTVTSRHHPFITPKVRGLGMKYSFVVSLATVATVSHFL